MDENELNPTGLEGSADEDLKKKLNKYTTSNQIEQARHDVSDMESYTSGLFAYSIFNTDENLLTPGLYETVV